MLNQNETPLIDMLSDFYKLHPAYFCVPGHRFSKGIDKRLSDITGTAVFNLDVTETTYTDDLHCPENGILKAQDLAADLFGAYKSYFLVNGTTCGNEAMIMASAFNGKKIVVARNCHKSVMMGMILSGAEPIYVEPPFLWDAAVYGGVLPHDVELIFQNHTDIAALMVTSPTYYGLCSDISALSEICHRHNALLLVDEAHGGHTYFSGLLPKGALSQGADMCVQSIHKVAGSMTQTSILHVQNGLADVPRLEESLKMVQSTSPSFVLLASLDAARHQLAMEGSKMGETAVMLSEKARASLENVHGINCVAFQIGECGIYDYDKSRLVISACTLGLTGFRLSNILNTEFGVFVELADYKNILVIITYANTEYDISRLVSALNQISKKYAANKPLDSFPKLPLGAKYIMSPREAYFAKKTKLHWSQCIGKISGEVIAPYPPGVPIVYPGEVISREIWEYINYCKENCGHIHGPYDKSLNEIQIIEI